MSSTKKAFYKLETISLVRPALVWMFCFLFSISGHAQECGGSPKTSGEIYKCALSKDSKVLLLGARKREREAREKEARQIPNPRAESELGFSSEIGQKVSILQPIEIGGRRTARIGIAESENTTSVVEDEVTLAELATDTATLLARIRQLTTSLQLLDETKISLSTLMKRLRAKAVLTPEEKNALTIFSMQSAVLDTQIFSVKQEIKQVRTDLQLSVAAQLPETISFPSSDKKEWPKLTSAEIQTFDTRLAELSLAKAARESKYQESLAWPELALGPSVERRGASDLSFGVKLEVSLPIFNQNNGARARSSAELQRAEINARRTKSREGANLKVLFEQYDELTKLLKTSPSQEQIRKSVGEALRMFSRGMIQPAAIVESYRSSFETLEAVQAKELLAYRLLWKLRSYSGDVPKEFL